MPVFGYLTRHGTSCILQGMKRGSLVSIIIVMALISCGKGTAQTPPIQQKPSVPEKQNLSSQIVPAALTALEQSEIQPDDKKNIHAAINKSPSRFAELLAAITETAKQDSSLLLRVDKKKGLSETWEPSDLRLLDKSGISTARSGLKLRAPALAALQEMNKKALTEGITLLVSSAYRSYAYQKEVFARNVKEMGEEEASRVSARPGSSQHQLGTAMDFGSITNDFARTKAGIWLAANAGKFGFSLSYPQGMEQLTGYQWESWHYRYIGKDAVALQNEFFSGIQHTMMLFLDAFFAIKPPSK